MTRRLLLIALLTVVSATATVLLIPRLSSQSVAVSVPEAPRQAVTQILIAAADLPGGMRLESSALAWATWPLNAVAPYMITRDARPDAMAELANARVRHLITSGEPITDAKIVIIESGGFMSAVLPRGMRAIAINISEQSAVSGFILPNDRVDVLHTVSSQLAGDGNRQITARAILRNVRVLAINRELGQQNDKSSMPELRTAVLEVFPEQAEAIAEAQAHGEVQLVLRSIAEAEKEGHSDAKPVSTPIPPKPRDVVILRYGVGSIQKMP